jgi:hypothetical protein
MATTVHETGAGIDQVSETHSTAAGTATASRSTSKSRSHLRTRPRGLLARLDHAILNLPPSFFSLNMGTGITSILLYNLPYNATWLQRIGIVVFVFNVLLFVVLLALNVVRYVRWKGVFTVLARDGAGMFWGTLPMGLATIVVGRLHVTWGTDLMMSRT